ncbi:DUF4388 domain-containing protein [bacterium]|nr:DUF4388 domain-containing protein [bacterium]
MAFEGDVKDFGLSEIFQLISVQQKSGMLLVNCEKKIAIFFHDGMIVSTRDRRDRTRDPLKDYLLRYGFLNRSEMNNLQQIQIETKLDLTEIMLSEKYYSEDELKTIFTDQIYETIQEILSWPKSHYKFISGNKLLQGVKNFSSIRVDAVLMESMRRIDEFPRLKTTFPSLEMMFKNIAKQDNKLPELTRNEDFIYELLEEEMKLSELISKGKMASFNIYEALKGLLEKELLQIARESIPEIETPLHKEKNEIYSGKRVLPTFATLLTLLACLFIGEFAIPSVLAPGWPLHSVQANPNRYIASTTKTYLAGNLEEIKTRQLEKKVRSALSEYMAERKSYPLTLEILSIRGFIPEETCTRANQAGFKYKLDKNSQSYLLNRE